MTSRAVIAGVTGLIGSNLAEHLVSRGWEVYGVARKPQTGIPVFGLSRPTLMSTSTSTGDTGRGLRANTLSARHPRTVR
jgi:nucleoside-diphosphate-sugar epimerase